MGELKVYKELIEVVVKNKNGTDVYFFPKEDYEKIKKELKTESHFEVAPYTLVNKFDVSIRPKTVDPMTGEIIKHPRDVQVKLLDILKERKQKGFKTRGFEHLWEIHKERESKQK